MLTAERRAHFTELQRLDALSSATRRYTRAAIRQLETATGAYAPRDDITLAAPADATEQEALELVTAILRRELPALKIIISHT